MEYIRSSVPGIMIDENTFWVSGGYNMDFQEQDTTEFIFSNGTVEPGPKLPTAYSRHCKVNFIYSEKATKFCEISTNYLTGST